MSLNGTPLLSEGSPLKIAMLSDSEDSGGAAIAAARLALGLRHRGHRVVRLFPGTSRRRDEMGIAPAYSGSFGFRAAARIARVADPSWWHGYWSRAWLNDSLEKFRPDVISVHNLHGANWPPEFLGDCLNHAPAVWTLHDCWSFTGRCVYPSNCAKYLHGCDTACPTASEYPALPESRIAPAWNRRQRLLNQYPSLVGVTPSRWLRDIAQQGLWRGHEMQVIANGLPLDIYRMADRERFRREMGITTDPVLLAASQNLTDPRKGLSILLDVLRNWTRPLTLITFGSGKLNTGLPQNIRLLELGRLATDHEKVRAYNAADIFVHPAVEDNLPNTVAESIACGTPVVAFAVGGLPEMVVPGSTGWLAGEPTAAALATTLTTAIVSPIDGSVCRRHAELAFDLDLCSAQYESIFRSAIERRTPAPSRSVAGFARMNIV